MRRWTVAAIVILLVAVNGALLITARWHPSGDVPKPVSVPTAAPRPTPQPAPAAARTSDAQPTAPALPEPPASLGGFWTWPESKREDAVTAIEHDPAWPQDLRIFIRQAIRQRSLADLTRNNMANGLIRQEPPDPELDRLFIGFLDDPAENPVWRDYSVQFLANVIPTSDDPQRGIDRLRGILERDPTSVAGTAALHLNLLAKAGQAQLPPTYDQRILAIATDGSQADSLRGTLIALLAERRVEAALPLARSLINHPSPTLRRSAVLVLGNLGQAQDQALILAAIQDANPLVVLAAQGALRAFASRTPTEHP